MIHPLLRTPLFVAGSFLILAGCSSATGRRNDASRGPAGQTGDRPTAFTGDQRRIPVVIRSPRPFRVADLAGVDRPTTAAPAPATGRTRRPAVGPVQLTGGRPAVPPPALQHPAAGEIRGMMRDYLRAFNRHDAVALASHWSSTAENHDLDAGAVTASGRAEVQQVFSTLFDQDDEAVIDIELTAVRPVKDDVAVVDGITTIAFAAGPPAGSQFSAVVVKQDGRWLLEHVRESGRHVPPARVTHRPLDELAWLVGLWEDDGAGVTASTRCDWAGNHSYLVRTHLVSLDRGPEQRPADGDQRIPGLLPAGPQKPREVVEVIGWDPDSRAFRSWFFASDGRFAEGTWSRQGDGWAIHVSGRGRDEGCTANLVLASHDEGEGFSLDGDPGRLTNLLPPTCSFGRTSR